MPKFEIVITREITESVKIEVEAESAEAAQDSALGVLEGMDAPNWSVDDWSCGINPAYVSDLTEILDEEPDAAQQHQMEQDEITDECEAGTCDHGDCHGRNEWADHVNAIMDRAEDGAGNLSHAAKVLRTLYPSYDNTSLRDGLADALADIRHLCDVMGWGFHEIDQSGQDRYQQEVAEHGPAEDPQLFRLVDVHLN